MYDIRLIDGFQGTSKIILNGNYSQAMSLSRFIVNKKRQNMEKKTSIHWININMTKTNIVLSNILCKQTKNKQKTKKNKNKEQKKSKTHNGFFKYFILCTQSRILITMLWYIGIKFHT